MRKMISVRIDVTTLAKLKRIAAKKERDVSWLLRKAAEEYAAREERENNEHTSKRKTG